MEWQAVMRLNLSWPFLLLCFEQERDTRLGLSMKIICFALLSSWNTYVDKREFSICIIEFNQSLSVQNSLICYLLYTPIYYIPLKRSRCFKSIICGYTQLILTSVDSFEILEVMWEQNYFIFVRINIFVINICTINIDQERINSCTSEKRIMNEMDKLKESLRLLVQLFELGTAWATDEDNITSEVNFCCRDDNYWDNSDISTAGLWVFHRALSRRMAMIHGIKMIERSLPVKERAGFYPV